MVQLNQDVVIKEKAMPVSCRLRILLARLNLERAKNGQSAVSLRRLAQESGVSQSVLVALHTEHNQRIDYATLDRLLTYFSHFLPVSMDDLLTWEPAPVSTSEASNALLM